MKRMKKLGLRRLGGKRGFTLIELLIVMVILAILAGVVIMAVGGVFGTAHESAYGAVKPQLQNGVIEYATDHNGALPPVVSGSSTTINTALGGCVTASILDICQIIGTDRIIRAMPDGCYSDGVVGNSNDNCDGDQPCTGCDDENHYVWYRDSTGNVYSLCVNTAENDGGCTLEDTDGYQGVWP